MKSKTFSAMLSTTEFSFPERINSTTFWEKSHQKESVKTETVTNNKTKWSINELSYNETGYYIEEEIEPGGLSDLQTLFLACLITLIPLIVSLLIAFGIRLLWTKYKKQGKHRKFDGFLKRQDTLESICNPLHSHLLNNTDKRCVETHLDINTAEDVEVCDGTGVNQIRSTNHSNTNGSIITMTLKNNHLMIETEERNDIEEDSRETTVKYTPGASDGVFVVEVQQGVRRSPGSGGGPVGSNSGNDPTDISVSVSDQCALVHNPPDRYSDDETLEECDDNEYYIETTSPSKDQESPDLSSQIRTGLAQSNTSLSSNHQTYCYTNQQLYDGGKYGYPTYNGYNNEYDAKIPPLNKPIIKAAVYKNLNSSRDDIQEQKVVDSSRNIFNGIEVVQKGNISQNRKLSATTTLES